MAVHVWAHVSSGLCDDLILLDASANPDWDMTGLVDIGPADVVGMPGIGWLYDGATWTAPD